MASERDRLAQDASGNRDWRLWGTYLPERQWGTVREDYSPDGEAWTSFPYEMSRLRAYRWGEDGLLGWTDRENRLSFSVALWNGRDSHLKDKLFGLSNSQGNHGEDVKELYYYLDGTPTGSYAKALYRYPQAAFPYTDLIAENNRRGFDVGEYELLDTGVFDDNRFFDVVVEYAKQEVDDTLIRLTIHNRGPDVADLAVLPMLTFRNTWAWDDKPLETETKPEIFGGDGERTIVARHDALGRYALTMLDDPAANAAFETLFTENDSNGRALGWTGKGFGDIVRQALGRTAETGGFSKDAFHRRVVDGEGSAVNADRRGTKAAFLRRLKIDAGASCTLRLRLVRQDENPPVQASVAAFDATMAARIAEADDFYRDVMPSKLSPDERLVSRQAYAGLLWSRQAYLYDVKRWQDGDPAQPPVASGRAAVRNAGWRHLSCRDVISMPDKWEYPWFAAWDLAFHMIPMGEIDPAFAKAQLLLFLSERYLHPNGALPAYEFGFGDVNPPVHAMAVWQVYEGDRKRTGTGDIDFLEAAFQKLLLNFTWWVNRNDPDGKDLFGGGFLGLDNIGLFDRNEDLPDGGTLRQADATAWMGLFCSLMMKIAAELAQEKPVYQDMGVKFFHHFMLIVEAINGFNDVGLWDEDTGFFYDQISFDGQEPRPLKVQSIVGLVPIFAMTSLRKDQHDRLPAMIRKIEEGIKSHPQVRGFIGTAEVSEGPYAGTHFVSLVPKDRMLRVLEHMLDEDQFLSPHGIRSVSKLHEAHPLRVKARGKTLQVGYVPGEGDSGAFGGNSNWRGPIWFPINVLLIHALQRYDDVYGNDLTVECPTGSGQRMTLGEVAGELSRRLASLCLRDGNGRRPCHGDEARYADDPLWRDLVLFSEYFHGDTGRGIGASHQTGWTATIATCIDLSNRR